MTRGFRSAQLVQNLILPCCLCAQDIRATLSNEPDPDWSVWPAWKVPLRSKLFGSSCSIGQELVAAAHPLHDTLRTVETGTTGVAINTFGADVPS